MDHSGKSLDTGKTVLILVNLPSCQWYVSSKRRYSSAKWQKFTDVCTVGVGGKFVPPSHHTNVSKIWWLWGAMSLLVVNKSLSNLTILLNALFPAESTDFLWLIREKVGKKKKTWRGLFELPGTLALVNLVSRSIRPLWFLVRPGTDAARRFHLLLHHRSQYFHFGTSISDVCG